MSETEKKVESFEEAQQAETAAKVSATAKVKPGHVFHTPAYAYEVIEAKHHLALVKTLDRPVNRFLHYRIIVLMKDEGGRYTPHPMRSKECFAMQVGTAATRVMNLEEAKGMFADEVAKAEKKLNKDSRAEDIRRRKRKRGQEIQKQQDATNAEIKQIKAELVKAVSESKDWLKLAGNKTFQEKVTRVQALEAIGRFSPIIPW